jgi:hypothetical protein
MAASDIICPTVAITEKMKLLIDRENSILARLQAIQIQYYRNERTNIEPGEVELLRSELEYIYDEIGKDDEQYISLRRSLPLSLSEIKAMI